MIKESKFVIKNILYVFIFVLTAYFIFIDKNLESILIRIFPNQTEWIYPRASILAMTLEHLLLVLVSSLVAIITGLLFGVIITRSFGKDFEGTVYQFSAFAQTFPPVAVLALVIPFTGFGFKPAILALILYSFFPVLSNTVAGIRSIKSQIIDAAKGMGMSEAQILFQIELPLAFPVILSGIRMSVVINVGTATLGALIGAGGLGTPIVSGLVRDNNSFVFQGALSAAFIALFLDYIFKTIEYLLGRKY